MLLLHTYVRNGFGDVIRQTNPDTRGPVTQIKDARNDIANMTYDNVGGMLMREFAAVTAENVRFAYDSVTAPNKGKGRLTQLTDQAGNSNFSYDARVNLFSENAHVGINRVCCALHLRRGRSSAHHHLSSGAHCGVCAQSAGSDHECHLKSQRDGNALDTGLKCGLAADGRRDGVRLGQSWHSHANTGFARYGRIERSGFAAIAHQWERAHSVQKLLSRQ